MSSLVTAVFKATIGLLVKKGRDKAAERLKEGDVTDEKFRGLIVREIDEIRSRLDGLARKDLIASISFFKEGIELLYEVFDKARPRSEHDSATTQTSAESTSSKAFSLAKRMRRLELIDLDPDLDESCKRVLSNAKDRFKDARREATKAFANEALKLSDRVLAMQYRVMATILETVDNPTDALAPCRVCIEELHCLPAVKESFTVELYKDHKWFRARFGKVDRRRIIFTVWHVNRAIYDVALMVCFGNREIFANWPCIDTDETKICPLRDERVAKVLKKQGMEHCCVPQSFVLSGQKGELGRPLGFATNTDGQYLVADRPDQALKLFDSNGNFLLEVNPITDDTDTNLLIRGIATDMENNIYVLVSKEKPGAEGESDGEPEIQVFNKTGDLRCTFPVRKGDSGKLTVSCSKVVVWRPRGAVVDVYEQDGEFVRSFGEGTFRCVTDIDAANDDRVMVADSYNRRVYLFTVEGQQLSKCTIEVHKFYFPQAMACHPAGEHVIVACKRLGGSFAPMRIEIHTTNGKFIRGIQLEELLVYTIFRIRVTIEGLTVVIVRDVHSDFRVIVV